MYEILTCWFLIFSGRYAKMGKDGEVAIPITPVLLLEPCGLCNAIFKNYNILF